MTTTTPDRATLDSPELTEFVAGLRAHYGDSICSVLLYGSCLRSGDVFDGIVDLYLICDNYRSAYSSTGLALGNWVLPPNVFYREQGFAERTLRAKVSVISLRDFRRGCSRAWFESYIWGRFAQPVEQLYCRDQSTRLAMAAALQEAATTLLDRSLPLLADCGTVSGLWEDALALSYGTELRSERGDRSASIVKFNAAHYLALTRRYAARPQAGLTLQQVGGIWHYQKSDSRIERFSARCAWLLRPVSGKVLSILRLIKALYTFDVGLDYLAWKLQRHSGQTVTIPDRVRRAPLIHIWGFAWQLYRRGIFK